MGTVTTIFALGLAGLLVIGAYTLWCVIARREREYVQRIAGAENRLDGLYARLNEMESEVSRQGVELEGLSIQLETRAYWED